MTVKTRAIPRLSGVTASPARRVMIGVLGAFAFAALTWIGANIRIPLQPVPITMQTLFVLLAGAVMGRGFGALSQALYAGVGLVGLPVFAGGAAGVAVLAGPTGGYLAGFVVAPLVVGALIARHGAWWWQAAVFLLGSLTIVGLGVAHLALFYTHDLWAALQVGYLPFIPGEILKIAAAVSIFRSYSALRRPNRSR